MPILTISELVLGELSQMKFLFGGTPADVVEYEDGGRKASGQAVSVKGLEVVADQWIVLDTSVVPTADANGMIPEFYGPPGILALKVDFGHGEVILRADAANLHKELRDILIARLSELQVDEANFRDAVSGQIDAMHNQINNVVATTLAEVENLIDTALGDTIEDAVDAKLATDLAPTLAAAINDALANDVPPLITAEVGLQVPPAVAAEVGGLTDALEDLESAVDQQGVLLANTRYDLDGTKARTTALENRAGAIETLVTLQPWSATRNLGDATVSLKLMRFQNIVFGSIILTANSSNNGATGWVERSGMGIPSAFLPDINGRANSMASTSLANGTIAPQHNYRVGITTTGGIYSQGYTDWDVLRAPLLYFTS